MTTTVASKIPLASPPVSDGPSWCCVQAGHREQYGISRGLERVGELQKLITDVWAPPTSPLRKLAIGRWGRRLSDRFHADIPLQKVTAYSWRALAMEARMTLRGKNNPDRTRARIAWWTALVPLALRNQVTAETRQVFSYCYEARPLFQAARDLGLDCFLGQIDPGPEEDRKVAEIVRRWPTYQTQYQSGSDEYYRSWREEIRLSKCVLVNSEWSREALIKTGIEKEKIEVIPLVYTAPPETQGWEKRYPRAFSKARPLRVLFLGQCILRKGIAETIEAAQRLVDRPIEFTIVGNTDISDFEKHFGRASIRYYSRVSRAECHAFYREADLFLFPTHSDGFGLTQLEAQAWKLPIIASVFCARVVEPRRTGWILPSVSSASIIAQIEEILAFPSMLNRHSEQIGRWPFELNQLGQRLRALSLANVAEPKLPLKESPLERTN